jgi:major type 1 subunit fimbrin (pilin)
MRKLTLSLVALAVGLAGNASYAATGLGGTVTFMGAATGSTCVVNGNYSGTGDFTVAMPTVSTNIFTGHGDTAGDTMFTVALTGCSPGLRNARVQWSAGGNVSASGNVKNTGTASNLEVQLLNSDGSVIKVGESMEAQNSHSADVSSGAGTLNYIARYYATGQVGQGTILGTATYLISYE